MKKNILLSIIASSILLANYSAANPASQAATIAVNIIGIKPAATTGIVIPQKITASLPPITPANYMHEAYSNRIPYSIYSTLPTTEFLGLNIYTLVDHWSNKTGPVARPATTNTPPTPISLQIIPYKVHYYSCSDSPTPYDLYSYSSPITQTIVPNSESSQKICSQYPGYLIITRPAMTLMPNPIAYEAKVTISPTIV